MSADDDFAPLPPKPKNWNELFAITEGLKTVPIEEIDRGRVDWEYEFDSKDMRPCGRKSCERKHAHGWLVALQGRRFVHIGNDCAEKYAHVEKWRANIIGYEARIAASARITATLEAREEAQRKQYWLDATPEIRSAIALHESFAREAGGPVLREIEKRAERGKPAIEREYRLTPQEMESRRAMLSINVRGDGRTVSSHVSPVETRVIGEIAGLECFRPAGKPGDLHRQLQRLVTTLLRWTPAEDDLDAARSLVRAKGDLGPLSNQLGSSLIATAKFFSESNLKTLLSLDVVRSQGIISIEREGMDGIRITRHAHWDTAA